MNTPIHNLQIEQAVLAALMTVSSSYSQVENLLTEEDFHATRHKLIFQAIVDLDSKNSPYYCMDKGRPAKPLRLMAGLLMRKYLENLSDENVVVQWKRNPYYQYFCGLLS